MGRLVVDASLILKWLLRDEECVEEAGRVKRDWMAGRVELVIPPHAPVEVASGLEVAVRRQRIHLGDALVGMEAVRRAGMTVVVPDWREVLRLSCETGISPYDGGYVQAALQISANLWTGDARLVEKAGGAMPWIRHLREYP